jgi:hypothetical protein
MLGSQKMKKSLCDIQSSCEEINRLGDDVLRSTSAAGRDIIERELRELAAELSTVMDDVNSVEKKIVVHVRAADELRLKTAALLQWLVTMEERSEVLTRFDMTVSPSRLESDCKVTAYILSDVEVLVDGEM